jgi:hypothetical protein
MKFSKKIIIPAVILLVAVIIMTTGYNIYEGLENKEPQTELQQTSCTQFYDCKSCVTGTTNSSSSPCYWNKSLNKCGSFQDTGYSRTCL